MTVGLMIGIIAPLLLGGIWITPKLLAALATATATQVAVIATATDTSLPPSTPVAPTIPFIVTSQTSTPSYTSSPAATQIRIDNVTRPMSRTLPHTLISSKAPSPITAPTLTPTYTTIPPTSAPTPLPGTIQGFEAVSASGFKTLVQVIYTRACLGTPAQCQYVWIDSELVTNAQYSVCQQSEGCQLPVFSQEFFIPAHRSGLPVVGVNWAAANQYCKWRSERFPGPGRLPTKQERTTAAAWIKGKSDHFEWSATTADGVDISITPAPKQRLFVFPNQEKVQEETDRNLGFRCVLTTGASTSSK
jgi:hypothetical protein